MAASVSPSTDVLSGTAATCLHAGHTPSRIMQTEVAYTPPPPKNWTERLVRGPDRATPATPAVCVPDVDEGATQRVACGRGGTGCVQERPKLDYSSLFDADLGRFPYVHAYRSCCQRGAGRHAGR